MVTVKKVICLCCSLDGIVALLYTQPESLGCMKGFFSYLNVFGYKVFSFLIKICLMKCFG